MKKLLALLLALALIFGMFGCQVPAETTLPGTTAAGTTAPEPTTVEPTAPPTTAAPETTAPAPTDPLLDPNGHYNSKEEVALYIHLYGCLPRNYVTKSYAKNTLGCSTSRVQDYWPDGAIGGDVFQNREGRLPSAPGRTWTECDIDTWGNYSRGQKRIVFSNDGLVYYTGDHYYTFELLYGDPEV